MIEPKLQTNHNDTYSTTNSIIHRAIIITTIDDIKASAVSDVSHDSRHVMHYVKAGTN